MRDCLHLPSFIESFRGLCLVFVSICLSSALACQTTDDLAKAPAVEFDVSPTVRKTLSIGKPGTDPRSWAPIKSEKVLLKEGEWLHSYRQDDGNIVDGLLPVASRLYSFIALPQSEDALNGIKQLKQLRHLQVNGQRGDPGYKGSAFDELPSLEHLEFMSILGDYILDAAIVKLANVKSLHTLQMSCQRLTEKSFEPFKSGSNLKSLRPGNLPNMGAVLAQIAQITSLEELDLRNNESLLPKDLAPITALKLKSLNLFGCMFIDDAVAKLIAGIKTLKSLNLGEGVQLITLEGYEAIASLPLERLELSSNWTIRDETVKVFAGIKTLKYLDLSRTSVEDKCTESIAKMESLETVNVLATKVSQKAVDELQKLRPKLTIINKK